MPLKEEGLLKVIKDVAAIREMSFDDVIAKAGLTYEEVTWLADNNISEIRLSLLMRTAKVLGQENLEMIKVLKS